MLALYRSGRQSEALESYRDTRATLVESVGIEPGLGTAGSSRRVLRQDPELTAPPRPKPRKQQAAEPSARSEERRPRRWRLELAGAIALMLALAAFAFDRWTGRESLPRIDANTVGVIDAETGAIRAQHPVGGDPGALIAAAGSTWVLNNAHGGPDLAPLARQHLPPGFPGFVPDCRYTLRPGSGGWIAPDLAQARRLIDASGTRGIRVDVWADRQKARIARYFVSLLRTLGYDSTTRLSVDYFTHRQRLAAVRTAQMGVEGWIADIAIPSQFLEPFACAGYQPGTLTNGNLGGFCDRDLDRRIAAVATGSARPGRTSTDAST